MIINASAEYTKNVTSGETKTAAMIPTGLKVPNTRSVIGAVNVCAETDDERLEDADLGNKRDKNPLTRGAKRLIPASAP